MQAMDIPGKIAINSIGAEHPGFSADSLDRDVGPLKLPHDEVKDLLWPAARHCPTRSVPSARWRSGSVRFARNCLGTVEGLNSRGGSGSRCGPGIITRLG